MSSKASTTTGPWTVETDGDERCETCGQEYPFWIAAHGVDGFVADVLREPDARLIAAAPDLLDALEQVAAFLGDTSQYLERSREYADNGEAAEVVNRVQVKVLGAIAGARGEV